MKKKEAIVIGSGVAGLATAARLATLGFSVNVFEKNDNYGGKIALFETNSFKFDTGPSLFTAPSFIEDIFAFANEPIDEYFTYKKLATACKYFYEDDTIVNAYTNNKLFAKELNEKLNEDENQILNYLKTSENLYTKTGNFFINFSLQKFKSYFSTQFTKAFTGFKLKHITQNLHTYNKSSFRNAKTVQLFNRYATYNGSNPYKASAMLSLISHLEHNDGTYYPTGGMFSIADALYKLALKKGVQFHFNNSVERIIVTNNRVKGIVVNNQNIYADTVVSNVDAYFTYKNLLLNFNKANKIKKIERSSSALIFYWGINKEFATLDLHNIFFSDNYQKEFEHIFKYKTLYTDPTIYINITSKQEPETQAPKGKENWFVMINVPSNDKINWDIAVNDCRKIILEKLSRILKQNIASFIETENILHPKLIESNTASYLGSLYGTSSNSKFSAFLRHPNFSNNYKGLYFVGGSVHPGGGIPLCLKSAEITSNLISKSKQKH
ncbi:MAG: phytoene desaturase family protein [Bacteroidetes bacterium]|nr:phytoene desaturase family protein [Bacteroidota bacterium]